MRRYKIERTEDGRWFVNEEEFVHGCPYWSGLEVSSEEEAKAWIQEKERQWNVPRPKIVHSEILSFG